jgi:hypothetical protein
MALLRTESSALMKSPGARMRLRHKPADEVHLRRKGAACEEKKRKQRQERTPS